MLKDEDVTFDYYNALSVSYFHGAQKRAIAGLSDARDLFVLALEAGRSAEESLSEKSHEWTAYISATIAYLDRNKAKIQNFLDQISVEENRRVVSKMLAGLNETGVVDYRRDYLATSK